MLTQVKISTLFLFLFPLLFLYKYPYIFYFNLLQFTYIHFYSINSLLKDKSIYLILLQTSRIPLKQAIFIAFILYFYYISLHFTLQIKFDPLNKIWWSLYTSELITRIIYSIWNLLYPILYSTTKTLSQ